MHRRTMHAWRRPSKMEWAKVLFVGIGCDEVIVGGKVTGPNMGTMGVLKD